MADRITSDALTVTIVKDVTYVNMTPYTIVYVVNHCEEEGLPDDVIIFPPSGKVVDTTGNISDRNIKYENYFVNVLPYFEMVHIPKPMDDTVYILSRKVAPYVKDKLREDLLFVDDRCARCRVEGDEKYPLEIRCDEFYRWDESILELLEND